MLLDIFTRALQQGWPLSGCGIWEGLENLIRFCIRGLACFAGGHHSSVQLRLKAAQCKYSKVWVQLGQRT